MTDREESLWFQELYLRFAKSLVHLSCRAGIELEISKEIMQHAFCLLLVKYDSLKDWHTNLPGWLIIYRPPCRNRPLGRSTLINPLFLKRLAHQSPGLADQNQQQPD